jgi:tripartite-type tricarboxylate transporter receptor subunit TctC
MAASPAINPSTPYDPNKDFVHIINVAATPNVIAVHPSFPAKDYKSFTDTLQKNPGKYSYGSAGNGTVGHLLAELYKSVAKVYVTHIPYRGSGPALNDVVAGAVAHHCRQPPVDAALYQGQALDSHRRGGPEASRQPARCTDIR